MFPSHAVILKAKQGEFEALGNLDAQTKPKVLPLFEVSRLTDAIRARKYISTSSAPTMTHINRVLDEVGKAWLTRPAMVDGYQWAPDARAENGDHVIAYMVSRLSALGVLVIPVIGYDRWDNAEYRLGVQGILPPDDGHYCLRLDSSAIEDVAEPEHFRRTIENIIDYLQLNPARCSVLLDFADISVARQST